MNEVIGECVANYHEAHSWVGSALDLSRPSDSTPMNSWSLVETELEHFSCPDHSESVVVPAVFFLYRKLICR